MKKVCISVKALYDEVGIFLTHGSIKKSGEDGNEYYDLYNNRQDLVACMDGEEVYITYKDNKTVKLLNKNGEIDMNFKLTREEFEIAIYC